MAAAIPAVMVAGAAMSAIGQVQAGKAQKTAALYNAQQDEANAKLSLDQSQAEAARFRTQADKATGSIIANEGANGSGEGSESILAESVTNAKLDEALIGYKGRVQAMGYYNSATLNRFSAKTATDQSELKAASAVLEGAGHASTVYAATSTRLRQGPSNTTSQYEDPTWEDLYAPY